MKYSVWALVKARWGWKDLWKFFGYSAFMTFIMSLFYTVTLHGAPVVWYVKLGVLAAASMAWFGILYLVGFLGSLAVYKLVSYGANIGHPRYPELYEDYLSGK